MSMSKSEAAMHVLMSADYWSKDGDPCYKPTKAEKESAINTAFDHLWYSHGVSFSLKEIVNLKRTFDV
ncbi:MAG: hypothetical protein PHN69_07275 [Candidatus Pacebacteria bacterium]|nr:hypothetical protein [Candidatus Paceibacterota bacterium]